MAYFIVHRSAAGWIASDRYRTFDTEAEARASIPRLAALFERPESHFYVTDSRAARCQLS
jgi:hypothetical protein